MSADTSKWAGGVFFIDPRILVLKKIPAPVKHCTLRPITNPCQLGIDTIRPKYLETVQKILTRGLVVATGVVNCRQDTR